MILLSLLVAACGGGGGGGGGAGAGDADGAATGGISGKALYRNIDDHSGIFISLESIESPGVVAGQTQTAPDGSYGFDSMGQGDYTLFASSETSLEKAVAARISVPPAGALTVEDIFLTPTGSISGNATLEGATDHTGIAVYIPGTSYNAHTSSGGDYTISDVPVDTHDLYAGNPGYVTTAAGSVTVTHGETGSADPVVLIPLSPDNPDQPPAISSVTASPYLIPPGGNSTLEVFAIDPEGEPLSYAWSVTAGQGSLGGADAAQALYTAPGAEGSYAIGITVTAGGIPVSSQVVVQVKADPVIPAIPDQPPAITSVTATPNVIQPGATSTLEVFASDPEGDALTYGWSVAAGGGSLSATNTAQVVYTAPGVEGTYNIEVTVTANGRTAASQVAVVAGYELLSPPRLSGTPPPTAAEDQFYNFVPSVADPNGGPFTFSIQNQPPWAAFDTTVGSLSGIPANADVGINYNIVITVTDPDSLTGSLPAFDIEVVNTNDPPVISGTPGANVDVGALYTFTPAASDPDGDGLLFSIVNKPPWAAFDTSDGTLSGIPTSAHVTTWGTILISVSDGAATTGLPSFAIVVAAANAPPSISGAPATTVIADNAYSFTPTAFDSNLGDTIFFTITGRPYWAAFDAGAGTLSGIPVHADLGMYSNIVITVSDGVLTSDLPTFSIEVVRVNGPPTANAGGDQFVVAGETITLDGTASSDPDVIDTVTYLWSQLSGTFVALNSTTAAQPTFVAPAAGGVLLFSLIVSDGVYTSTPAQVTVTVSTDTVPTATIDTVAYPTMIVGGSVNFTASAGGGNGVLLYNWDFPGGTPASSSVEDPGLVVFDTPGAHTITLTVSDEDADTAVVTFDINVVTQIEPVIVGDTEHVFVQTPQSVRDPILVGETQPVFTTTPFSRRELYIISDVYDIDMVP